MSAKSTSLRRRLNPFAYKKHVRPYCEINLQECRWLWDLLYKSNAPEVTLPQFTHRVDKHVIINAVLIIFDAQDIVVRQSTQRALRGGHTLKAPCTRSPKLRCAMVRAVITPLLECSICNIVYNVHNIAQHSPCNTTHMFASCIML